MTEDEYYQTPPQIVHDEIYAAACTIWLEIFSKEGCSPKYIEKKTSVLRILSVNKGSNAWALVQMLHPSLRQRLGSMVSEETEERIKDALS